LKYIFTIAFSETDGYKLDGTLTDCEYAKQYFKCRIAGITFFDDFLNNLESTSELKEGNNNSITSIDDFDSVAIHEEIQISKNFLKFCKLLPCWSAVIYQFSNMAIL